MEVLSLLILLLLLPFFVSLFRQWYQRTGRAYLVKKIENERGSKVIMLIHRQQPAGFFGLFFPDYINIRDAEKILNEIRDVPEDRPIDIILHTPGGLAIASEQIARALAEHKGKVTAFIPYYAMSGGTMIAMAANEIIMGKHALLGRLDPQIFGASAYALKRVVERKNINEVDDKTIILAASAEQAIEQVKYSVREILTLAGYNGEQSDAITKALTSGNYTHDFPVRADDAQQLGLRVKNQIPEEVYELVKSYSSG